MTTPSEVNRQTLISVLACLKNENYKETVHQLERESGIFFDMEYFEELVINGDLDEAEKYLSGFTSIDDNPYSSTIFFQIRQQKYVEALLRIEKKKAIDILTNELKFIIEHNKKIFEDLMMLSTLEDIKEVLKLIGYVDIKTARTNLFGFLKKSIHQNVAFQDKLHFPKSSIRLKELLSQSMQDDRRSMPSYICGQPHDQSAPFPLSHLPRFIEAASSSIQLPITTIANSAVGGQVYTPGPCLLFPTKAAADDLPEKLVAVLSEGSSVSCMAFHPLQHNLLFVGTCTGDVSIWDVDSKQRLVYRKFMAWHLLPKSLQSASQADDTVSVSCVSWSQDGAHIGVGYSKRVSQIYLNSGGTELNNNLKIDAHDGCVRDIAFSKLPYRVIVVTCGDDNTVKVWHCAPNPNIPEKVLKGHTAAVHSVCLDYIIEDNGGLSESIISTDVDGRIIQWLNAELNTSYLSPGLSTMRMRFSANGLRLFSCGTNKGGQSYLVEWEYCKGLKGDRPKGEYQGLGKSVSVVSFDIALSKYLAVGDESVIKFWHMDHSNILATIDVGGLPASPCIRFNKEGTLLAVSTADNAVQVLANTEWYEARSSSLRLQRY